MCDLVFGGSFNPIHNGHLMICLEAAYVLGCSRIFLIPAHIPAHKTLEGNVTASDRYQMTQSVCGAIKGVELIPEDCEIRRKGISYTFETLEYLTEYYKFETKPYVLIGDDLAEDFHTWKNPGRILELSEIIVARRFGNNKKTIADFPHRELENAILPISSSDIRSRIQEGRPYQYLVPQTIFECIETKGFYK